MTSKEYLKKYKDLIREEDITQAEIEHLERQKIIFNDPNSYIFSYVRKQQTEAETKAEAIKEAKQKIINNINSLDKSIYRDILYYHYIELMPWEAVTAAINEAAERPHSINNIKQYGHNKALEALQNILDNK